MKLQAIYTHLEGTRWMKWELKVKVTRKNENWQSWIMISLMTSWLYVNMWTCEQSAVTAVSRPRPRLQDRQVLTAASVCGRRETPGARQSGQPLSWVLPRMRTPRSLHNLGWRGHWPPTGAVYSLCRSVTQFLLITASNGACTCMQPCPGRLLLKTVMVSNDIMNWIHSNMQQFWNQHTSIFIVSFFLNFYSNYILILKMHVKVGLFIC